MSVVFYHQRTRFIFLLVASFLSVSCLFYQVAHADSDVTKSDEYAPFRKQLEPGHGALNDKQLSQNKAIKENYAFLLPAKECDEKLMRPSYPIFRDLKHVVFDLIVPNWPDNLKKYQEENPPFLKPEYISKIIAQRIQESIMPQVERSKDCSIQHLIDVTGKWKSTWDKNQEDTLIIIAKFSVTGKASARIATLSLSYFRPQLTPQTTAPTPVWLIEQTSIPFSLSDTEMKEDLNAFVESLWTDNTFYADFVSP